MAQPPSSKTSSPYLAVLGREPEISLAELSALFTHVRLISSSTHSRHLAPSDHQSQASFHLATFDANSTPDIHRLGGTIKIAKRLPAPLPYLIKIPQRKIVLGLSDYSPHASTKSVKSDALKFKQILTRHDHSVRLIMNNDKILSTATALHNGLSGKNPHKLELIKYQSTWYQVIGIQDIDAYTRRDQARPARDAKVGMLPPKLAQILINLCGPLAPGARLLDPFCGTGVVLQEALLMGYQAYGTDINPRMIDYSGRNLTWLLSGQANATNPTPFTLAVGDATLTKWSPPINAVACECFLGSPMSAPPSTMKLKSEKSTCGNIILNFLRNLAPQIPSNTPITIAIPAWLTPNGQYSRLEILDLLADMGYNVNNKSREGLLYHREGQIVARDIIIMRKK